MVHFEIVACVNVYACVPIMEIKDSLTKGSFYMIPYFMEDIYITI